jgi:sialic acid synthase SpsE
MNKFNKYIIAEIGINHNGKFDNVISLINLAKKAGADAVKFQLFKPESLSNHENKKRYKILNKSETLFQFWNRVKIKKSWLRKIRNQCKRNKIEFGFSVFDTESLNLLKKIDLNFIKIASSDINDFSLLKEIMKFNKPIIVSTGMANIREIKKIYNFCKKKIYLLHCVSLYPTELKDINLNRIKKLSKIFNCQIGFSDHTIGTIAAIKAFDLGANIIEKHFTLDKNMIGPDHKCSADYNDLKQICYYIKKKQILFGNGKINPSNKELEMKKFSRKGIYAKINIKKKDIFSDKNLIIRRPYNGLDPDDINKFLGKKNTKYIKKNQSLKKKYIN